MAKNYYIILGVDRGANAGQIKHAYRRIAKQLHPDRFCPSSDPEKFIEAKEAYDTLADVERRRRYDDELRRQETPQRMTRNRSPSRAGQGHFPRGRPFRPRVAQGRIVSDLLSGLGALPPVRPRKTVG